ncbi:MobC family plasmid mobilization relaxosome protein [Aeromonas veronii]|uniref:MobC family plasmid mobilization relaxosome protein n=1 Tax=Aeromonas veronii TaxID=654 RepID=UPI003A883C85
MIKIRATDEEFERLKELSGGERLAEWMRGRCLGHVKGQDKRRVPVPKADPALLRQLAGIGNNLNQVARRINCGEWGALERVQVIGVLMTIERALVALAPSTPERAKGNAMRDNSNNDSAVEYDYTLTRLPGDQGWSLRLLQDGNDVGGDVYLDHDEALSEGTVWLCRDT